MSPWCGLTTIVFNRCAMQRRCSATHRAEMVTGAGHDAMYVGRVAPASMIHIPCLDGLSHNEAESATAEDLEAGCNVLMHAMLKAAGVGGS